MEGSQDDFQPSSISSDEEDDESEQYSFVSRASCERVHCSKHFDRLSGNQRRKLEQAMRTRTKAVKVLKRLIGLMVKWKKRNLKCVHSI